MRRRERVTLRAPRFHRGLYAGGRSRQRWFRELLREAMGQRGFAVYEFEWWHFDHRDWRRYPVVNATFDSID